MIKLYISNDESTIGVASSTPLVFVFVLVPSSFAAAILLYSSTLLLRCMSKCIGVEKSHAIFAFARKNVADQDMENRIMLMSKKEEKKKRKERKKEKNQVLSDFLFPCTN